MENRNFIKIRDDNKLVLYSFVFLTISDLLEYAGAGSRLNISFTYVTAVLKLISIICIFKFSGKGDWKNEIPKSAYSLFKFFMFWSFFTFLRGALFARDYWDWKFLVMSNSFNFLIPYAIIIGIRFNESMLLFRFILIKVFKYGFFLLPLAVVIAALDGLYVRMMHAVGLFLLFGIYMKRKWLILIVFVAICSLLTGSSMRANSIRIIISMILILTYYFRSFLNRSFLKLICLLFFITPFIFIYLGITNVFNVFKVMENDPELSSSTNAELGIDTRTLLYLEVYDSMDKHDSLIFGEGGSAKYESAIFDSLGDGRGRYGAEVGFLNMLLYSGILGVSIYFLILLKACYYAMNYSNNYLSKLLAIFVAARWVVFFVEDVTLYDLNIYFLWIAIGLCLSSKFRKYSDSDISNYFLSVTSGMVAKV